MYGGCGGIEWRHTVELGKGVLRVWRYMVEYRVEVHGGVGARRYMVELGKEHLVCESPLFRLRLRRRARRPLTSSTGDTMGMMSFRSLAAAA